MEDNCILPQNHYMFIWRVSFLSFFVSMYALYNRHYDLALVPGGVFITSINYWRKPNYSWRRYVDISYVKMSLLYQLVRAYNAQYARQYYILVLIAMCFYPLGIFLYKKKLYWYSTYAHIMLHIIGNLSNTVLYSGYVCPLSGCVKN